MPQKAGYKLATEEDFQGALGLGSPSQKRKKMDNTIILGKTNSERDILLEIDKHTPKIHSSLHINFHNWLIRFLA